MINKQLEIIERKDLKRNGVEAVLCNIYNNDLKILL